MSEKMNGGSPRRIRVVTANIQSGLSPAEDQEARRSPEFLPLFGAALAKLQPDVACLQEVDRYHRRSGHVDQTRIIAQAAGAPRWCFAPATDGYFPGRGRTPAATQVAGAPGYGDAILSWHPVKTWLSYPLPRGSWYWKTAPRVPVFRKIPTLPEARQLQVAHVDLGGAVLPIGNAHLSSHLAQAREQAVLCWELVRAQGYPTVLAGDFNIRAGALRQIMAKCDVQITDHLSYPAVRPMLALDHVVASAGIKTVASEVVRMPIGDHLALVVDLEIDFDTESPEIFVPPTIEPVPLGEPARPYWLNRRRKRFRPLGRMQ